MGNKLFNADNPFNRFMSRIFDIIIVNLLWLLLCLPVITFGASSIALYTMTLRMVRDEEGSLVKGFFKAFRDNFKQSIPVTIIFFILYGLAFFNLFTFLGSGNVVLIGANIAVILMITGIWVWIIPLIARYENTLAVHFNNAWRLAIANFPYTLTFIVLTVAPIFWAVFSTKTFIYVIPLWILLGGGGIAAINSIYLRKAFDKIEGTGESRE